MIDTTESMRPLIEEQTAFIKEQSKEIKELKELNGYQRRLEGSMKLKVQKLEAHISYLKGKGA